MSTITMHQFVTPDGNIISWPKGRRPLYKEFRRGDVPQRAYLEIRSGGHVSWIWDPEVGPGISEEIFYGTGRRYECRCNLTSDEIATMTKEVAADVDAVIAGLDSTWDGRNRIGVLSAAALAAEVRICARLERWRHDTDQ